MYHRKKNDLSLTQYLCRILNKNMAVVQKYFRALRMIVAKKDRCGKACAILSADWA
jgi:hypothetical protein